MIERWVHESVPELAVPQSRLPKSQMKGHLFGDAAKPHQRNGIKPYLQRIIANGF